MTQVDVPSYVHTYVRTYIYVFVLMYMRDTKVVHMCIHTYIHYICIFSVNPEVCPTCESDSRGLPLFQFAGT